MAEKWPDVFVSIESGGGDGDNNGAFDSTQGKTGFLDFVFEMSTNMRKEYPVGAWLRKMPFNKKETWYRVVGYSSGKGSTLVELQIYDQSSPSFTTEYFSKDMVKSFRNITYAKQKTPPTQSEMNNWTRK